MDECYAVLWMMLLAHKAYGWKKERMFLCQNPNLINLFIFITHMHG
jgi:hypothetical protein